MEINLFAIFLSFIINLSKRYSTKLCSYFLSKYYSFETREVNEFLYQLKILKKERDAFNPIDEFAKFALVDRKINKLNDKLKENKGKTQSDRMKKMMYFNVAFTIFTVLMSIVLIWGNYDKPIIDFTSMLNSKTRDSNIDTSLNIFFPLNKLLSFPNKERNNSIGVTAWLFIVNRFIDIVVNKINTFSIVNKVKSD